MFTNLSKETTFTYLAVMNAFRMLAIAMVMMPVTTAGLNELPPHLIPHGSAMNNTFRQVSGAVGTAMLVTIMATSAIPTDGVEGLIHPSMFCIYKGKITAVPIMEINTIIPSPVVSENVLYVNTLKDVQSEKLKT